MRQAERLRDEASARLSTDPYPSELRPVVVALNLLHERWGQQILAISRFAENIAHELRNPLNILIGEADIALSKDRSPAEYKEVLRSTLEECRDLSLLEDSLLLIARTERASTGPSQEWVDLHRLVQDVAEFYEPLAEQRGIRVKTDQVPLGLGIRGDRLLLKRAVANLVANAIEYGKPHGQVRVHGQAGPSVSLSVEDEGPGLSTEEQARIFERFYRTPLSRSDHPQGTGLGLALVRSITQMHGGKVSVRSASGEGTTFTLSFPITGPTAAKET